LPADLYLAGADVSARHACDWSKENAVVPPVVLRPRDTQDVSRMLKLCHAVGQPLVIQGGLTGLSGGATPRVGEWAISLERLQQVLEVDATAMTISVGAGTPLEVIQRIAEKHDCQFPLDLGARGSCLAGGLVATNAGGNAVIHYGTTRSLVLGLVAVLADGTIVAAHNKMLKNNAGWDVKQLFIGSEGILGVVTEVTFRLVPRKRSRQTALCAARSFSDVVRLLKHVSRGTGALTAFEAMWDGYFRAALAASGSADPFREAHACYVLLELEGGGDAADGALIEEALGQALEEGMIVDAVIAKNAGEAEGLWRVRDAVAEIISASGTMATFDIGVPISAMERFLVDMQRELDAEFGRCDCLAFGHVGDGNLHVLASTGRSTDKARIYDRVYRLTQGVGGTISAEHGIGVLKKDWLPLSRSDAELALMRSLKATMDPKNILNRGRIV
jgi:FAD/FMN-containing dehydrogenase